MSVSFGRTSSSPLGDEQGMVRQIASLCTSASVITQTVEESGKMVNHKKKSQFRLLILLDEAEAKRGQAVINFGINCTKLAKFILDNHFRVHQSLVDIQSFVERLQRFGFN